MIKVYVNVESRYPVRRQKIVERTTEVLKRERVRSGKVELGISIVGNRKMKDLARIFLDNDEIHEVLSFPLEDAQARDRFVHSPDKVLRLGDVVISYPKALAKAVEKGKIIEDEINFLVEHGILHLLGYHHPD